MQTNRSITYKYFNPPLLKGERPEGKGNLASHGLASITNKINQMKNTLIIISLVMLAFQLPAQQALQWEVKAGGTKEDVVNDLVSPGNDIYITGKYFGDFISGGKEVKSRGAYDIYLARLNGDGKTAWVRNLGGIGNDEASCLASNGDNIYIAGLIYGTVTFGNKEFDGEGESLFVSQCSANGKPDWLKRFRYTGHATLDVLEYVPGGRLLIGGLLYGTINTGKEILESKGVSRAYTILLSAVGEPEKAILSSGNRNHRLVSATYDGSGNQYLLFSISGFFNYGEGTNTCSSGSVSKGLVLIKSAAGGQILWHKSFECPDYSEGMKVITNELGDVFVCANFAERLSFSDTTFTNNGQLELAVMAFGEGGNLKWAQKVESTSRCRALDAVITHSQELLVTGSYREYRIGGIFATSETFMGDLFLLQFDKSGNPVWHDEPGKDASSFSKAIALDRSGNVILAGGFSNKITIGGKILESSGEQDIFIIKYFNCAQNEIKISDDSPICPNSTKELKASGRFKTYLWNDSLFSKSIFINSPGTYFVEATDELGCASTDTVEITQAVVNGLYLDNDTTLYQGEEITLTANEGFTSYEWSDGHIGQSLTIGYDANTDSTAFRVVAQTDLGCVAADSVTIKFGGKEFKPAGYHNSSYKVYPNPVKETLYWYIETDKLTTVLVKLTDGRSTLVYEEEVGNYIPYSRQEIDMRGLASGNYLLSLVVGDIVLNEKIVKK